MGVWEREIVFEPTMNSPAEPREPGVPPIVTPDAPGRSVELAKMMAVGFAVRAWPAMDVVRRVAVGDMAAKEMELVPMTRATGPREIGILETVIAGALDVRVVPAMDMPFVSCTI